MRILQPWRSLNLRKLQPFFKHFIAKESLSYKAWSDRLLFNRLRIVWGIFFAILVLAEVRDVVNLFFDLPKFIPDKIDVSEPINFTRAIRRHLITALLAIYWTLHKTQWAKERIKFLYLYLSWSFALAPQFILTFYATPFVPVTGYCLMLSILQTIAIPIGWRLHLGAWLLPLSYYTVVNALLGTTSYQRQSIYNSTLLVTFLICGLCSFATFTSDRLHRTEFEYRRRLEVLLHSVSHDLKTPVMGTSMVLSNWLNQPGECIKLQRSVLEKLRQGSDRQLSLINSLLEARNTEIQGIALHLKPTSIHCLAERVLGDLAPILAKHRVDVNNFIRPNLPLVNGDETQLWRVYNNLISNALKHNPPGISITLEAEIVDNPNKTKNLVPNPRQQCIYCIVRDNGVGISPEQQPLLFELYARGHSARYMPGLGLGLYLCQQIIRAHGGEMGANSHLGEGATFWFTLPLGQSKPVLKATTAA